MPTESTHLPRHAVQTRPCLEGSTIRAEDADLVLCVDRVMGAARRVLAVLQTEEIRVRGHDPDHVGVGAFSGHGATDTLSVDGADEEEEERRRAQQQQLHSEQAWTGE